MFMSLRCSFDLKPGANARSIMRWPCTSRILLCAKPPSSAARTLTGSTPDASASASASATASIVTPTTIWLQALVTCPAPSAPTCTTFLPSASKIGFARANAASPPPAMIESAASIAPFSPPLTGASTDSAPFTASAAATRFVVAGAMVLMSIHSAPARMPCTTPSSPSTTDSTSGESGSIVMTTSLRAATSCGVAPAAAPSATSSSTGPRERFSTISTYPAASRLRAIGLPMMPRPMNPIAGL